MAMFGWCLLALLVAPSAGIAIADITKCQAGVADLVGTTKALTAQVCNLFGGTCYINQVELASASCATEALMIPHGSCALFPIMSYANYARGDATQQTVGSFDCSVSCTGTDCKFSGGCVSVQCSTGASTFVGPAKTGSGSSRTTGVANTGAAGVFTENTFAEITGNMKTVFLSRTGNYVGTYSRGGSATGTVAYNFGKLPNIDGNNYGPEACPSSGTLMSAATGITKEQLRMCGNTGKWMYFAAVNLLMDKSMGAKYSGDSASGIATTKLNIGSTAFLKGESAYRSGTKMDDSRQVYLYSTSGATGSPVMSSATITPAKSSGMATPSPDIAGTWRTYSVVFYCTDYARTDLTTCAAANQAMLYVADPNPSPAFGASAGNIGAGGDDSTPAPTPTSTPEPEASGSVAQALMGAASFLAIVLAMQL